MITKEQREELRKDADRVERHSGDFVCVSPGELRDLLDMAQERDRLRELLNDALADMNAGAYLDGVCRRIEDELYGSKS